MRTTIDLPDDLRAKLLELAARRGEKGFSALVREAVTRYLAEVGERGELVRKAQAALGQLGETEADRLADTVRTLRSRWR